jgi:hypothetical protein
VSGGIGSVDAQAALLPCSIAALTEVTASCGAASAGSSVPDQCDDRCSASYTPWFNKCQDSVDVKTMDAALSGALYSFWQQCVPKGGGGKGPAGGGH